MTHLSEILKSVTFHSKQDISCLIERNENFSLKQIPEFANSFRPKQKNNQQEKLDTKILFDEVIECLLNHDCMKGNRLDSSHECRFLVQALLGVRLCNTYRLEKNSFIRSKTCQKCSGKKMCKNTLTSDCFDKLFIFHTKNKKSQEIPILPQIISCIENIKLVDQNTCFEKIQEKFNNFMRKKFNATSHKNRANLPNLQCDFSAFNNTGNWLSIKNMDKFYLSKDAKYIMAYCLIKSKMASL